MPAEWAPHERCLMAWPARRELWGPSLERAKDDYAATARAIAGFEPVLMVASPEDGADARDRCGSAGIDVVEEPIDDSWLRDSGPIVVLGDGGRRAAVDFEFNAWGEVFAAYDRDVALTRALCERLSLERHPAPFVLEGGSICVDGEGTLVTTEQCLLHPNRNPSMSRAAIEQGLRDFLGVEKVVWLGRGLAEDRDTDGHVDLIAAFTRPGHLLLQAAPDESNPNAPHARENLERLRATTDARGRAIEVTEVPFLPYAEVAGETVAAPYLNFYLADGAVIVPVTGAATDPDALDLLRDAYPGRAVLGVPGAVIALGGGGPHCITQQVPAPR